jgi:high-affinity K+ transport system ATPase subunit B
MAKEQSNKLFEPALVKEALKQSFVKLNPRIMMRNPVMFTVEIGTAIMLAVCIWILAGEKTQGHFWVQPGNIPDIIHHRAICQFCRSYCGSKGKGTGKQLT